MRGLGPAWGRRERVTSACGGSAPASEVGMPLGERGGGLGGVRRGGVGGGLGSPEGERERERERQGRGGH